VDPFRAATAARPTRAPVMVRCVGPMTGRLAAAHAGLLTPEEHRRAASFHRLEDRTSFLLARAALRDLLATVLHCSPQELRLTDDSRGKPVLVDHPWWAWNLTRTRSLSLIALRGAFDPPDEGVSTPAVGIDAEPSHRRVSEPVVERLCTPDERAHLDALSSGERQRHLLRLWVRKEAVAKADGRGLGLPFTSISIDADENVAITGSPTPLWVRDLHVGEAHVAALATEEAPSTPTLHQWP